MPAPLVDVSTFTTPVSTPVDGDALNGASVLTPSLQPIANRTRYLVDRVGGFPDVSEWSYGTPRVRATVLSLWDALRSPEVDWSRAGSFSTQYFWDSNGFQVSIVLPLNQYLRDGMIIGALIVLVKPSTAQVLVANRMFAELMFTDPDFVTPAAPTPVAVASATDDGTAAFQNITIPGPHTVDRTDAGARDYYLHIVSANVASGDRLHGVQLSISSDPGPRNV